MIRQHVQEGGFPANRIAEIKTVSDATTAEAQRSFKPAVGVEVVDKVGAISLGLFHNLNLRYCPERSMQHEPGVMAEP